MPAPVSRAIPLALLAATAAHAQSIRGMGILSGAYRSVAWGVSADGEWAVGTCFWLDENVKRAFRWNIGGGMRDLGSLPTGTAYEARGVNADGSVIVGFGGFGRAYRWTPGGGMQDIGLPASATGASAMGVSAGGSVIAGYATYLGGEQAIRWAPAPAGLGMLFNHTSSRGYAVSADGSVVVGESLGNGYQAVRWTAATGMVGLGTLPGGTTSSAHAVSADGQVVVGSGSVGGPYIDAFRWSAPTGIVGLGRLPGSMQGNALAVNSDGSIVLGSCYFNTTGSSRAFLWRQDLGMVDLNDYALAHGVNLGNWTLGSATGISADNQVIVGTGWNGPNIEGFMIRLGGDPPCYPNCDGSTTAPILDVLDFNCFINRFFAGDTYANCDGSTSPPVLNVLDFNCFLNAFAAACP